MIEVSIDEADEQLEDLVDSALAKGPVILTDGRVPRARLIAISGSEAEGSG